MHAKGTVAETSKVFWSTKDPTKPFTYDAGVGAVITGASSLSVSPRVASTDTDARVFAFAFLAGWDQGVSAPEWAKSSN